MLSLCKLLSKPAINLAINNSARSIFTPAFFRIDTFKSYVERIKQENGANLEKTREILKLALTKSDSKLFPDDVKTFLYQTQTDEDLNLLIDAIKKYYAQSTLSLFNFNFDAPLMRLLYTLNKTDKALELFNKEEFFKSSVTVTTMLMNKLMEEKRFDEAIKIGIKYMEEAKPSKPENKNPFSFDAVNLLTQALLEKNDANALEQAKIVIKKLVDLKLNIQARTISNVAYLALEQKKPDVAFEVSNNYVREFAPLSANIKILCMIDLNRLDEAVKLAEELSKRHISEPKRQTSDRHFERLFFRSVLEKLVKATESNEELKKRVQVLNDKAVSRNMLQQDYEIRTYLLRLIEKRQIDSSQQMRSNNRFQNNQNQQSYQPRQSFNQRTSFNNNNNNNNSTNFPNSQGGFRRQQNTQEEGQGQQQQKQQQQRFFNDRRNVRQ